MSEKHEKVEWKDRIPPGGLIFGLCLALGAGGWALLAGWGAGIESFGSAQRAYPQVVMGFIAIIFAAAAYFSSRDEKKSDHKPPAGGADHH